MMAQNSSDPAPANGRLIVALARSWIGTPYRHQASCKGVGTDCLGLVRGVWREAMGAEPEEVPPYTSDWSETSGSEDLLDAATRHMSRVQRHDVQMGDTAVLRMRNSSVAKHIGFLAKAPDGYSTLIHAYSGHGVVESALTPAWSSKIVAFFRFPDRSK